MQKKSDRLIMSDTKDTYPIPDAGYPQKAPPVVAPPQYSQATTMLSESHCLDGFLEGWYAIFFLLKADFSHVETILFRVSIVLIGVSMGNFACSISCMCFVCLLDGCCDPSSLCNC